MRLRGLPWCIPGVLHSELNLAVLRGGLSELGWLGRRSIPDGFVLRPFVLLCKEQVVREQTRPARRRLSMDASFGRPVGGNN